MSDQRRGHRVFTGGRPVDAAVIAATDEAHQEARRVLRSLLPAAIAGNENELCRMVLEYICAASDAAKAAGRVNALISLLLVVTTKLTAEVCARSGTSFTALQPLADATPIERVVILAVSYAAQGDYGAALDSLVAYTDRYLNTPGMPAATMAVITALVRLLVEIGAGGYEFVVEGTVP